MKTSIFCLALTALALTACGGNAGGAGAPQGEISQNRTTAFKSFMPSFSSMGKVVKGDEPYVPDAFKATAAQFTQEARAPFEYFQNDPQGNGGALPVIWQKPAEFKAEQDKFLAAVDKLNAAAQSGRLDDIRATYQTVGESCKSCHQSFRRPK